MSVITDATQGRDERISRYKVRAQSRRMRWSIRPHARPFEPTNRKFAKLVSYCTYRLRIFDQREYATRRGRHYDLSLGDKKRNESYMLNQSWSWSSWRCLLSTLTR